jgi:hypothetical protein
MSAITNLTRRARLMSILIAAIGAVALVPAAASASTTWFGSSLDHTPANAGSSCSDEGVGPSALTSARTTPASPGGRSHPPTEPSSR